MNKSLKAQAVTAQAEAQAKSSVFADLFDNTKHFVQREDVKTTAKYVGLIGLTGLAIKGAFSLASS